jgi:hypothetical protein
MLVEAELVGFVELKVGSLDVRVPVRKVPEPDALTPLATFTMEGAAYAIMVRDKDKSAQLMEAVHEAAEDALKQLSKKLLN